MRVFSASVLIAFFLSSVSHGAPTAKPALTPSPAIMPPTGPAKRRVITSSPVSNPDEGDWKPWSVGFVAGYMDYKEPGLMREYGNIFGVQGSFTFLTRSSLEWNFESEFLTGKITYDGGNLSGARYSQPTSDWILNGRATLGFYRNIGATWSLTPYAGFGFRDLNDKIEGSGSYNRNISYVYLPFGAQIAGFVTRTWSLLFSADLDLMIYGTVISKLSDVDSSAPDVTNHNKGIGGRLTATIRHDMGRYGIHAGAAYQKWKIDQSDGVRITLGNQTGTLYEPENEFDFFGINVGADF
jgi:hypothetical protein